MSGFVRHDRERRRDLSAAGKRTAAAHDHRRDGADRLRGDDGTILVLTLGFAAILLLMVAVVVNVSAVVLAKRGAASAADGAAVSAAQALDLGALYAGGLTREIPLTHADADERVQAYAAGAREGQPGLQLSLGIEGGSTAVVEAVRVVRPPFPLVGPDSVTVRAVARARAPVVDLP